MTWCCILTIVTRASNDLVVHTNGRAFEGAGLVRPIQLGPGLYDPPEYNDELKR
jgi:hypothetical protein